MNAKEMWELFSKEKNLAHEDYEAWAFGEKPDELADLVMRGN